MKIQSKILLYDTLKTKYNIEIAHINRQIHATVADPYLSDLLGIMENAPLLYITTVAYNQNDIPFEYSLASYRADMYKMNVDYIKINFISKIKKCTNFIVSAFLFLLMME